MQPSAFDRDWSREVRRRFAQNHRSSVVFSSQIFSHYAIVPPELKRLFSLVIFKKNKHHQILCYAFALVKLLLLIFVDGILETSACNRKKIVFPSSFGLCQKTGESGGEAFVWQVTYLWCGCGGA